MKKLSHNSNKIFNYIIDGNVTIFNTLFFVILSMHEVLCPYHVSHVTQVYLQISSSLLLCEKKKNIETRIPIMPLQCWCDIKSRWQEYFSFVFTTCTVIIRSSSEVKGMYKAQKASKWLRATDTPNISILVFNVAIGKSFYQFK